MEIESVAAGSCSKENQMIYKEWFEFADSGPHLFLVNSVSSSIYDFLIQFMALRASSVWCKWADGDGRITGNDAITFFSMSNLPRPELKQVKLWVELIALLISWKEGLIALLYTHALLTEFWGFYGIDVLNWLLGKSI